MDNILKIIQRYEMRAMQLWYQTKNNQIKQWYDGYAKACAMAQKLIKEGIVK